MLPMKSKAPVPGSRRPWQPPRFVKFPLSAVTKSRNAGNREADSERAASNQLKLAPLTAPTSKLGFSFEWSLPLSIRTED